MPRWLLPESISDVLPTEARRIEELRRRLLDLYRSYGYELVAPPLVEHLDSLLTGSGHDLALRTFQLVDQLSGRTLGVRADMTPQVARIDAHLLNRQGVARLCYAGSVLHTRASGLFATREPLQIGAEIYGHAGIEADLEIVELLIQSLRVAGVERIRLDLCHEAVVPSLLNAGGAAQAGVDIDEIYRLMRQKDLPALAIAASPLEPGIRDALLGLASLYLRVDRGVPVLERIRAVLPPIPAVDAALVQLGKLLDSPLWARLPDVELSIDLSDLRGRYHSGISFAAFVDALPNAIARGGRYDSLGRAFGRARPATGFSLELRELASQHGAADERCAAIRAPWSDDGKLRDSVAALRASGEVVIQVLPGHEHEQQEFACDRELVREQENWVVRPI